MIADPIGNQELMFRDRNAVSRDSLVSGLAEIQSKMPAIGGIAFGPLILQDALFENMELETMQSVLEPKVEGARHLNDLFFDNDLEFFVMFSSLVMIGGNPGQSNYSAANAYMTTVAAQRRTRGLAVSDRRVHIVVETLLTMCQPTGNLHTPRSHHRCRVSCKGSTRGGVQHKQIYVYTIG